MSATDKAVSKWERNLSCPDVVSLARLAETLGISLEELLSGKAHIPQQCFRQGDKENTIGFVPSQRCPPNILCVHLVFFLYAEDVVFFGRKTMFVDYLSHFTAKYSGPHLSLAVPLVTDRAAWCDPLSVFRSRNIRSV